MSPSSENDMDVITIWVRHFELPHHLNSPALYIAAPSAPREIARDLFPVVVKVFDSQYVFDVSGGVCAGRSTRGSVRLRRM